MALGLKAAGFEAIHASDADPTAVETLKQVIPGAQVLKLDPLSAGMLALRLHGRQVDLLAAGVPCQPWSIAGKGLGEHDPRDGFPAFSALAGCLRPRAILIENVKGLTGKAHAAYFDKVLGDLRRLGYHLHWRVLNAADFGVPQRRERVFVVGFLDPDAAARFRWPEPTHSEAALVWSKWGTAGEARGGIVGGSYWEGASPQQGEPLGVISEGGKQRLPPHRPMHGLDEPSPTQRVQHGGGGCGCQVVGIGMFDGERYLLPDGSTQPVRPAGGKDDPKHPVLDLDSSSSSIRSGGSGHDAPPVYVQGVTQRGATGLDTPGLTVRAGGNVNEQKNPHLEGGKAAYLVTGAPQAPSRQEQRILRKILDGKLEVTGGRWRTVRDALTGLIEPDSTPRPLAHRHPLNINAPSLTVGAGGSETGGSDPFRHHALQVIGAGSNPWAPENEHQRNRREITDEPGPTMTSEQIGNRGPWVANHEPAPPPCKSCPMDAAGPKHRAVGEDEPALTVKADQGSGDANLLKQTMTLRRLTPRECARLQNFPDWLEFKGTKTAQYRAVGNALCPKIAEVVGRCVYTALEG